jgi:hypothetical protein
MVNRKLRAIVRLLACSFASVQGFGAVNADACLDVLFFSPAPARYLGVNKEVKTVGRHLSTTECLFRRLCVVVAYTEKLKPYSTTKLFEYRTLCLLNSTETQ